MQLWQVGGEISRHHIGNYRGLANPGCRPCCSENLQGGIYIHCFKIIRIFLSQKQVTIRIFDSWFHEEFTPD